MPIFAPRKKYIEYENTHHVIEFWPQQAQLCDDLTRWLEHWQTLNENYETNSL